MKPDAEELADLRKVFNDLDRFKTGVLSVEDIRFGFIMLDEIFSLSLDNLDNEFDLRRNDWTSIISDFDGDDKIGYDKFITLASNR